MSKKRFPPPPGNREEFLHLMTVVDEVLQAKGTSIPTRPLAAALLLCKRFKMSVSLVPCNESPNPASFAGEDLIAHANAWFLERYGDRIKVDFSPGSMVIMLQADVWRLRFPRLLGPPVRFICHRPGDAYSPSRQSPTWNVLDMIEGATPTFKSTLSDSELQETLRLFSRGFRAVTILEELASHRYIAAAWSDLHAAVSNFFATPPDYARSKSHSSELTEKILKCFLDIHGGGFPCSGQEAHSLRALASLAEARGLQQVSRKHLNVVQGDSDMRYGEAPVTLDEAISAHHASLDLAVTIGSQIQPVPKPKPHVGNPK